ncbi:MAG: hypothetical protein ABI165_10400 [Bryobacteraceae bacterium]
MATADLLRIRDAAARQAAQTGQNVTSTLVTKEVRFGQITEAPLDR